MFNGYGFKDISAECKSFIVTHPDLEGMVRGALLETKIAAD